MYKINYEHYSELISRMGADVSTSESHGILCGLLCTGKCSDVRKIWADQLVNEQFGSNNITATEFNDFNSLIYAETIRQINHETLEFSLLLPDENEQSDLRVEALAKWCQGFNFGLAIGGFTQSDHDYEDVNELIRDFSEIAKAGYGEDKLDDQEETALFEIEEYVRIGVLFIMEELNPVKLHKPVLH